jgi:DNA-binding IclR family transcriptional regulator/chloramphenicol 3-O-phosphotransferase
MNAQPFPGTADPARRLILIIGPIASGKSTLAETLAGKLRRSGEAVTVVGLDTVAEMALPTLADWTWAHEVHGQLVGAWLEKPIPTVIAEGPETPVEIEQIMRYVGPDVSVRKVLITTSYESARARASADPTRGLSKDPEFLLEMHRRFEETRPDIAYDVQFDTDEQSSNDIADRVIEGLRLAELEERRVAYPVLLELTEQTGETSALMVWSGTESMCVEQIASRHQIKHTTPLGARYNDAMSASVQVFLAAEPVERVNALLRSGGITYPGLDDAGLDGYQIRLKEVARRGWAINYGESSIDEVGVAAPVFDHRGDIVAAVLIPAPRFRVSQERLQSLGEACAAAARRVTTRLGGRLPENSDGGRQR